ncbi:helix-hairpin-helix domain-containing protein, partial [Streptomyces hygroscopicus]|uniref:helix-hairpin-helix domain-containing protein n=1 Tax=Streptomyces hygroscopicus TaxID=1912 RepID=UPI003625A533
GRDHTGAGPGPEPAPGEHSGPGATRPPAGADRPDAAAWPAAPAGRGGTGDETPTAGAGPHGAPGTDGATPPADEAEALAEAAPRPADADREPAPTAGHGSRPGTGQDGAEGTEAPGAAEASGDTTPAEPNGDTAPPETNGDTTPSKANGNATAAEPSGDATPDTAAGSPTPTGQDGPHHTETNGDTAPPETNGNTAPGKANGNATTAEPSGDTAPADASGDTAPNKTNGNTAPDTAARTPAPAGQDGPHHTEASPRGGSGERAEVPGASGGGGGAAGKGKRSAAAEALAAAVRAVESGERSAASFFNDTPAARPVPPTAPAAPVREQARAAAPASAPAPAPVRRPSARPAPGPGGEIPGSGDVRQVLAAGGAPETLAGQVAAVLGERAAEALREDPWQLLAVPGVRPDQADGFARALLGPACEPGDERRALALTGWLLERAALEGHTALESSALREALAKVSVPDPDEALRTAIAEGAVLVFQDALDAPSGGARPPAADDEEAEQPVRVLLGLDRYALAEESLADGLARLAGTFATPGGGAAADDAPAGDPSAPGWESAAAAAPTASAAELIRTVAAHGLVVHSGGEAARAEPAALVAAARAMGLRAYAAAHSEDGRRRLAASLGEAPAAGPEAASAAVTVAALLADAAGPGRDEEGALALDLLAVLDAPQLDVETAAMLVESLPDGARLVLSGDPGVLWSAGPGRVFADLVAARRCPQIVSRTPDPGPIGELVSGIGIGELLQVEAPGKEVVIVPVRDAGEAVHRTVQLVADSVPRAIGVPPEQTQVITPGHGGAAGTRALNAALKNRLNPGPGRFGGFDPGDRVAYTPAPGRTVPGTVVSADAEGLRLDCAGAPVVVPRAEVGELVRHGWALTAHQAAGMRWPAAVVVLPGDATAGLTRSWVYTAFGRGERHLSVVHGADGALPRAVAEIPFKDRTTRLRALLQAQVPAESAG